MDAVQIKHYTYNNDSHSETALASFSAKLLVSDGQTLRKYLS